jgi:hypothetical protein
MLTRRCKGRKYRLRPSPETNQIIEYAYGYAAMVTRADVYAITAMSTHPHDDFTDTEGRLPDFARIARRIIATCLAKTQNIPGPVFCRESRGSVVRLTSLAAMVEQLAYVIANPVTSFACKKPEQWRGVWVNSLGKCARRRIVQRPKVLGEAYPESVVLEVTWPRALVEEYGEEGTRQMVERRVEELCAEARQKAEERGRTIPRPDAAERLDPNDSPSTPAPTSFTAPTWAARGDTEAARRARRERRAFMEAYRAAWKAWKERDAETSAIEFPCGTYWMRVVHACATAPPS